MMPPRIARLLLRLLLPPSERRVITGDLDEELRREIVPARGAHRARLWYWRQVLASIPYALRMRLLPAIACVPADARYALRMWRRSPTFSLAAVATQAIGIALATAIIAVAYPILAQPLPYRAAGRIVQIFEGAGRPGLLSYADFIELRQAVRGFETVAGFSGGSRTLHSAGAAPERVGTAEVTDGFFEVLGISPAGGRTFTAADGVRAAAPVVILSDGAWRRRLGADPSAVGQSLVLNGVSHTIVGILPPSFEFPLRGYAELWLPLRASQQQEERGYWHWMDVIGRLNPDATTTHVEAELAGIAAGYAARDAKFHGSASLRTEPLRDVIVGHVRPTVQALLAGAALVLVATCVTLAGLLLARGGGRSRELSVRAAVGAGRGRLVRQLLTENVMLACAGGVAGLIGGRWLLGAFVGTLPAGQRAALPHFQDIGLQPVTVAAVCLITLVTGVVVGAIPALRAARRETAPALQGTRTTGGRRDGRLRFVLVCAQVAVAFVLLAGAALLSSSVLNLLRKDPGFDPSGVLTVRLTLSGARYAEAGAALAFHEQLAERLASSPAIQSAAFVSQAPLTGRGDTGSPRVVGRPPSVEGTNPDVSLRTVSPNYFATLGIPLLRGRVFDERAQPDGPGTVIVNQLLAQRMFGPSDPIGQRLTFEFAPGPWEIVGVVGDEQLDELDRAPNPVVYFSSRQDAMRSFALVVRSADTETAAGAVREVVSALDPALPVFAVRTIEQITDGSAAVFMRRAAMWMLGIFAAAAVLLAAMGLYGVLAQAVAERTREIGVRVALGATRGSIFALVLRRGFGVAALGLALGLGAAMATSRLLASLLFDVRPAEPWILGASMAFLAAVALVACLVPAVRAVRIDPASAVRAE